MQPRYAWYSFFFFLALIITIIGPKSDGPSVVHGAPPPDFSIELNATNSPTSSTEYTDATHTVRYTDFEYYNAKASSGNHIELGAGGGLYNSYGSQITSVTSVTATFVTEGTLTLYTTFDTVNYFDYPLVSGVKVDLQNLPYYTDFWADEEHSVTIESIVITYTCTPHEESLDTYRVTWLNDDGSLLELDVDVEPGTFPSYDGPTPTKEDDSGTVYVFDGWSDDLSEVYGNCEYRAVYSEVLLSFSLINEGSEYQLDSISDNTITSIIVPSEYMGKPVTAINDEVFVAFANLVSVTLPSGLVSIGSAAFALCSSLISVELPASVSVIGESAFYGCSALTSFVVDEDNPTFASVDGVLFSADLTVLHSFPWSKATTYAIPNGTETIDYGAFSGCTTLTTITIPSSVETIGPRAFDHCSSLDNVVIPDTVTTLSERVFAYCTSLSSITMPSGLTTISSSLFYDCESLETLSIPTSITSIGNSAFSGCVALDSISLPEGLLIIDSFAFDGCSSLSAVTLPSTLNTIRSRAFSKTGLTEIAIPSSVTSIGTYAFIDCPQLTAINVDISNMSYSSNDGVLFDEDLTTLIAYPAGKTTSSFTVPSSVTTIVSNAIRYNSHITSLYIPVNVTTIEYIGVYFCTNLTIYCEASEKPVGWDVGWNSDNQAVVWNHSF